MRRVGSRFNPIPFSTRKDLICEKDKILQLCVTAVLRGEEAKARIQAVGQLLTIPPQNMEWILLYVEVRFLFATQDGLLTLNEREFRLVSNNQVLQLTTAVTPYPPLNVSYFQGASGGGWIAGQVYVDDPYPLLVVGMDERGQGGFYFATQP